LAKPLGKFSFLAKPQKTSSNNLAKALGKLPSLAKVASHGAYLRAADRLASLFFVLLPFSRARESRPDFLFPRARKESRSPFLFLHFVCAAAERSRRGEKERRVARSRRGEKERRRRTGMFFPIVLLPLPLPLPPARAAAARASQLRLERPTRRLQPW